MPNPLDILKDPNYVKANTATKQAIFDRRVATLPEYRNANSATQADIRRRFNIETPKERYARQQAKQRADEKSALRDTGSKIASAVSGAERGLKSVADKLDYLNPLAYIPNPFTTREEEAAFEKRLAQYAAERQQANPNFYAGGKIGGEIVGTLPLTMGTGAAIQLGGRALTPVMSRAGPVIEKFGRVVTSGGTGVRAPTGAAETTGKIIAKTRKARNAYRAAGGSVSSIIAAAATDHDLTDAALAGATVPVLGHILKYGAGKTYDIIMGRAGPVEAARILREVISVNATKIESALRNAPKNIKANTAEFLASRGLLTPELAAATQIASGSKQSAPLIAVAQQRAAGQNRMREVIAGGKTQTEAVSNIAETKKALQDATGPQREGALGAADIGRLQIAPAEQRAAQARAALQRELDTAARYMDDPNFDARIGQYLEDARSAEEVAANLRAQGLEKLDISKVVSDLRAEADKAQFASPDRYKILSEFANNLERRAAKFGGIIDAQGLNLARREMGAFVSSILGTTDPKALRAGTSQLIAAAQKPIDDAIEAAGGAGWKNYLNTFAEGMKGIERQQFQRELTKLPEARFAKVMKGEDPDFVESKLGPGRYDINAEMQGADLATANKLGRDIQAQQKVAATGLEGLSDSQKLNFNQGLTAIVGDKLSPSVPNAFTAGARLVGSIPKVGGGGMAAQQFGADQARKASERTMTALVPALASPRQAGELLRVRPAEDYISRLLYGSQSAAPLTSAPRQFAPGTAAQAVANRNALTPAQQAVLNQNAMSQARQQAVAQTGVQNVTPPTLGEEFGFPDFDPETGEPLIDIDSSEGYPVPIYGKVSRNKMRR
jgi:hypothetical protein